MSRRRFPRTLHDARVRRVFSRTKAVAVLLRHLLPPHCIACLDLGTLRRESKAILRCRDVFFILMVAKEEQEQEQREQAELAEQRRWLHRWRQGCIAMIDELCADRGLTLEEPVRERMYRLEQRQLLWLFNEIVIERAIPRWVTRRRKEEPSDDA